MPNLLENLLATAGVKENIYRQSVSLEERINSNSTNSRITLKFSYHSQITISHINPLDYVYSVVHQTLN